MFSDFNLPEESQLTEMNTLRVEAMSLFERCLADGSARHLEGFVQHHLAQDPPRLELLREVADDLHQRLMSLRENHFDVRERVLRTMHEDYRIDLTPLMPPDALDTYHLLKTEDILLFLCQHREALDAQAEFTFRKSLDSSLGIASQLFQDVRLTEQLYDYIMDWVMGLNAVTARRYGKSNPQDFSGDRAH